MRRRQREREGRERAATRGEIVNTLAWTDSNPNELSSDSFCGRQGEEWFGCSGSACAVQLLTQVLNDDVLVIESGSHFVQYTHHIPLYLPVPMLTLCRQIVQLNALIGHASFDALLCRLLCQLQCSGRLNGERHYMSLGLMRARC
jgi:hypothetical protein